MRQARIPFYNRLSRSKFILRLQNAISQADIIALLFPIGNAVVTAMKADFDALFATFQTTFLAFENNQSANKDALDAQLDAIWPTARDIIAYFDSICHRPSFPVTIYTQIGLQPPHRDPKSQTELSHLILHTQVKLGESPYTVIIKCEPFTLNNTNEHKRSHDVFVEHPITHERHWIGRYDNGKLETIVPISEAWKGYLVIIISYYLNALGDRGDPSPEITILLPGIPGPPPTDLHKEPKLPDDKGSPDKK